ncbi:DUF5677 domain-containing protein [Micromonospora arida]|uniref:DUF5677 domain-containing protein n=1 Tax=Micromonospora arida TaxID=2203715 RepID=UPI0034023B4D
MAEKPYRSVMSGARFHRLIMQESVGAARRILAASKNHERQAATYARMRAEIYDRWVQGWEYFDAVIYAMQQNGVLLLQRDDEVEDDHSEVRRALSLIHSSGTIVLYEIRTLLAAGLWSGGAARWRALHELAVTAKLVAEGERAMATRYLSHGFVVQTDRLLKYWEAHGRGPVAHHELLKRQERCRQLIDELTLPEESRSFRDSYGWAAPLMPISRSGKRIPPTFDRLEKLAGLEQLRLLVSGAHGLVHADSAGSAAAVVMGDDAWALGPVPNFAETVARPALMSAIHCIGSTHLGFESEINDFAQDIGLLAGAAMKLAGWGVEAFESEPSSS